MLKIVIVHYGESFPIDSGYRPLRYGRFAETWHSLGHEVVRIGPSFGHLSRKQRQIVTTSSDEGTSVLVSTTAYSQSKSWRRLLFLVQFLIRSSLEVRRQNADVVLVGYPPPFQLSAMRLFGVCTPTVVDIRDLWFDHRQNRKTSTALLNSVLSKACRLDLCLADSAMALSSDMADWYGIDDCAIAPIGVVDRPINAEERKGPLRCVFVGSLNQHFELAPLIEGWPCHAEAPTLTVIGTGPDFVELRAMSLHNENVEVLGAVPSSEIPQILSRFDVGLAPTSVGFGTTLSNKVCEYLAAGLFVIHSLETRPSDDLSGIDAGSACRPAGAVGPEILELDCEKVRNDRLGRRNRAVQKFGASAIAHQVLEMLQHASRD